MNRRTFLTYGAFGAVALAAPVATLATTAVLSVSEKYINGNLVVHAPRGTPFVISHNFFSCDPARAAINQISSNDTVPHWTPEQRAKLFDLALRHAP